MATKAKKANKQTTELKEGLNKIKDTAKNVNEKVYNTTTEVVEDVLETGKQLGNIATESVKEAIENFKVEDQINKIKNVAKNANSFALEATEEVIDVALKGTEQWQGVTAKAIDGTLKLAEKQQEIVFDTLEALKGQAIKSGKRVKALFN